MFIIWGFGHQTVRSFGSAAAQRCSRCNNTISRELVKVTTWFTLFFIPIIPYRKEYLLICPICRDAVKISKVDFEQLVEGVSPQTLQSGSIIGNATPPRPAADAAQNKYAGKTETQIAYLKQMEELEKGRQQPNAGD